GGSFALKKGFQILEKNPELKEKIINELADTLAQGFEKAREKYPLLSTLEPRYIVKNEKGRKIQAKTMLKELEREQKGLYNVAFNGKNASLIKKDLEAVDEAILFEKGRENAKTNKGYGAKHILKHTIDKNAQGYITDLELVNIGKDLREFLKNYEPFIDTNGARLYEWEKEGVRFRLVVGDIGKDPSTTEGAKALSLPKERIITFYSDRNLKEKMNFKNPLLKDTIAESTMQGEALSKELESKEANTHTLREQTKELLSALVGKNITNQNDGRIASISRKNIMKMTSDKAIQKSVNNGFTPQDHFKAVQDIESLYQGAVLKETHADRKSNNPNVFIHRYTADFNGNNALITIKESLDSNSKGNKIYTLELETLELKPSAPEPQGSVTMSKNTGYAEPVTPNETHKSIIAEKNAKFVMQKLNEKSDNIYHSNPHLGAGLVGGTLNGVEQDENGNLSFDPVKFAMGFLGGSVGSFALKKGFQILEKNPELKEKIITELADTLAQGFEKAREKYPLLSTLEPRYIVKNEKGRKIQAKTMLKELEREQKGLYNVAFNGKNASLIKKDLEAVDEAILFEKGTKRKGGKHIRLAHSTEPSQEGYVTKQEVANLGVNIREYLKNYEPFIDKNGARLYEWKDENGVKFRAVVNNTQTSGGNSHLPSASEEIITFYSDRNLKEKMNFKNPLLKDTIAESTMQGEALSKELEKSFLDESGRIAYKALIHKAEVLPQSLNLKGFKQMIFNNDKTKQLNAENALIKTPVGEVKVNVLRAFNHYMKNGKNGNHKENRQALNATFMPTLLEPKFVTRDEEGTMYYYKPFISKDKEYHITSIAVKKNGNLDYATSYNATENRLRQMIKHNELVYKKD
ncbi:hypothetical protein LSC93_001447, partial [Campylobacter upsaliensis]|nr:hypothetical protein [Campylobacter upsaliensis]